MGIQGRTAFRRTGKMAGATVEITDQNFQERVLKSEVPVVIDFWAPWCGPCRMVAPIFEDLANEYAGKLVFGKFNTDDNPIISSQLGVMSIPTMIVFSGGQEVARTIGARPREQLKRYIDDALAAHA